MGWLPSFGSSSSPADAKSKEAYEAPDRVKRAKCWDSRDAYFKCLDENNILDAIGNKDTAEKACGKESQSFEQNCASSWVQYFKQRRVAEYEKEQLLKRQQAEMAKKG